MKKLFEESLIYESVLLAYYSNQQQPFTILLNGKLGIVIERFLEIFMAEDKQKGTNHTTLIQKVYANPQFENRAEFYQKLHVSKSTLQRYRERYCSTLKMIMEHLSNSDTAVS